MSNNIPKRYKAAVYDQPGTVSTKVIELETPEPKYGEVLIRLTHSGVCHSDYGVMTNSWAILPRPTEVNQVGGHEGGSGIFCYRLLHRPTLVLRNSLSADEINFSIYVCRRRRNRQDGRRNIQFNRKAWPKSRHKMDIKYMLFLSRLLDRQRRTVFQTESIRLRCSRYFPAICHQPCGLCNAYTGWIGLG